MANGTPSGPWLFGPLPDLVLGCGLGYAVVFLIFSIGGEPLRLAQPEFIVPLISVLVSGPHYGATLLRVYERRADRRAYAIFSVWATLLVIGLFTLAVYNSVFGSLFFTVFITWSPWHYTGQNYGVGMMFLRRGGVPVTPLAQRLLHTSFYCSFLITFLVIHTLTEGTSYNPNPFDYGSTITGIPIGIPYGFTEVALVAVSIAYVGSLIGAFALLARGASLQALLPLGGIVLTQALWFSLPFSFVFWGWKSGLDTLDAGLPAQYVFWTAIGHALQYQFVTTYYARNSSNWSGYASYFGKCLAAGAMVWTLPAVVFAPDYFGQREFTAGLGILVAAGVNIHHFILDGAIWKLRNSRIANVLIRSVPEEPPGAPITPRRWPTRALWAACGIAAVVRIGMVSIEQLEVPAALRSANLARAEFSLDLLAWVGRDNSQRRLALAGALERSGDGEAAEAQYSRSFELRPSLDAAVGVARQHARRDDWQGVIALYEGSAELQAESPASDARISALAMRAYYRSQQPDRARAVLDEFDGSGASGARGYAQLGRVALEASDTALAIRAYREALLLQPGRHSAANDLAWILATSQQAALRDPAVAIALAERAVEQADPPNPNYLDTLATAYAAAGRPADAIAAASQSLEIAEEQGDESAARTARESLARHRRAAAAAPSPDSGD